MFSFWKEFAFKRNVVEAWRLYSKTKSLYQITLNPVLTGKIVLSLWLVLTVKLYFLPKQQILLN